MRTMLIARKEAERMNNLRNQIYDFLKRRNKYLPVSEVTDAVPGDPDDIKSELLSMCKEDILVIDFEDNQWLFKVNSTNGGDSDSNNAVEELNELRNNIITLVSSQNKSWSLNEIAEAMSADRDKVKNELLSMCNEDKLDVSFENDKWMFEMNCYNSTNDRTMSNAQPQNARAEGNSVNERKNNDASAEQDAVKGDAIIENIDTRDLKLCVDQSGKLDVAVVASYFADGVLFFQNTPFERNGDKLTKISPQFNLPKISDHSDIQNMQAFSMALQDLLLELDGYKDLVLPKEKVHKKILEIIRDDRLTGVSFLNLLSCHMVRISEREGRNAYVIYVDQNLIAGVPDAYHYICRFLQFARRYNKIVGAFSVEFESDVNVEGPIAGKLIPVSGAAEGKGKHKCSVDENGSIRDYVIRQRSNNRENIDHGEKISRGTRDDELSDAEYESKLEQEVVDGLQKYACEAFLAYKKIPRELKGISFSGCRNAEDVVDTILNTLSIGANAHWLINTLVVSYWENAVHFDSGKLDALTYDIRIRFENGKLGDGNFDPNQIPNDLITEVKELSESKIYTYLLRNAIIAQNRGKILIAPNSLKSVILELEKYGDIEISGTQYEGRSERIEKVKVGDTLELVRKKDNIYDRRAIELQNKDGSLGMIPTNIAEKLAPILNEQNILCTAVVSEVVPLSKRSSRSRKAILKVRLHCKIMKDRSGMEKTVQKEQNEVASEDRVMEQRIRDREASRKVQDERDTLGKALKTDIQQKFKNIYDEYETRMRLLNQSRIRNVYSRSNAGSRSNSKGIDTIINDFGRRAESIVKEGLTSYYKMKPTLSAGVAMSVIEAIEKVLQQVDQSVVDYDDFSVVHHYHWKMNATLTQEKLNQEKKELSAIKKNENRKQREEEDYKQAKEYGVSIKELSIYRRYMDAKGKMEVAKTSDDYRTLIEQLKKLKGYRDSQRLIEICDNKMAAFEEEKLKAKKAVEEWKHDCAKVKAQRARKLQEQKKKLNREYEEKLEELRHRQENEINQQYAICAGLTRKIDELQEELDAAGVFAFSKKKDLKERIIKAEKDRDDAYREKEAIVNRYTNEQEILEAEHHRLIDRLSLDIAEEIPMPPKTAIVIDAERILSDNY